MQTAYIVKSYSPILLAVSLGFSSPVFAEGLNLDSLSDGLTSVQEGQQTVETGKQLSTLGETAAVKPSEVGLTETLVSKLGISSAQAEGGAGVIFKAAQEQLDAAQFAQIGAAVPEMDSLLSAAPKSSTSSLISSASSMLGDSASSYGNLAALASSFSDLNLSPDMVDAFVPVVVDYVKRRGGAMTGIVDP
ncbi:MAG: DUF2780 domain-containing protein [Gammaproteobacteria bacterium]|nr:DUF2780 domain-containing protein [Gammaproteobacteria bacterium]MBT4147636.1 DUF2780 domain-containing protein [Gammaproteobacteria bacterium]